MYISVSYEIPLRSSVQHGCLLSPLISVLYLEPLYLSVLTSRVVHGFSLKSEDVNLLAYDAVIERLLTLCSSCIVRFCTARGAVVNLEKYKSMCVQG